MNIPHFLVQVEKIEPGTKEQDEHYQHENRVINIPFSCRLKFIGEKTYRNKHSALWFVVKFPLLLHHWCDCLRCPNRNKLFGDIKNTVFPADSRNRLVLDCFYVCGCLLHGLRHQSQRHNHITLFIKDFDISDSVIF